MRKPKEIAAGLVKAVKDEASTVIEHRAALRADSGLPLPPPPQAQPGPQARVGGRAAPGLAEPSPVHHLRAYLEPVISLIGHSGPGTRRRASVMSSRNSTAA